MSIDSTHCAVCHGPLSRQALRRIEDGYATCEVCGLVLAACGDCRRNRVLECDAVEERFEAHVDSCLAGETKNHVKGCPDSTCTGHAEKCAECTRRKAL